MSFFKNIIADSRPRSKQFESSPLIESTRQTMELREGSGGFETHLSGKSDEYGIVNPDQDDKSSEDYAGSDQHPENKYQVNNSDSQPPFVKDQALADKKNRSKEEGEARVERQPGSISETFSSRKKNEHSFEYTVETLSEPISANGTSSSDRRVIPEPERNNSSNIALPDDESPMQMIASGPEGAFFKPKQVTAPDGKRTPGRLPETSGEADTRQANETTPEAAQKVKRGPFAGRPHPDDKEDAVERKPSVASPKQNSVRNVDAAAMDRIHTLQTDGSLQKHDADNRQADGGQVRPEVYIGRIDIVVEAPAEETIRSPVRNVDSYDFSSRHYLRRL